MTDNFAQGAFALLAVGLLIGLFYTAWQHLVVDAVRHRMFEIRDRTFLWAYDHGRLDDAAYREFRQSANFFIRHYENISLVKLLVLDRLFNLEKKAAGNEKRFPADTPFEKNFQELTKIAARGLVLRSLVLIVLFSISFPVLILAFGFLWVLNSNKESSPSGLEYKVTSTLSREIRAELEWAKAA